MSRLSEQLDPINKTTIAKYVAVAIGILVVLWVLPMGCTDPAAAVEAAHDAGFTKVEPTGYRHFGCGWSHGPFKGYGFQTGFEAEDSSGHHVVGVVCAGYGLGPYVRSYSPGTFLWRLRDW